MIGRNLSVASAREFDVIVVGGGIYGASLLQEAARIGLSACLFEAADFGSGTSWNSLRIVHGGLRYLQTLDFRRFFQSVSARRRIAQQFPSLVKPMKFLMPLYGNGLRRASVLKAALVVNDLLAARRNEAVQASAQLPGSYLLDIESTRRVFPQVRTSGLHGAACWSDYFMISSERILIELLHDACNRGAVAINYAVVDQVLSREGVVLGVAGRDVLSGQAFTIRGKAVVNCAGPRVDELAASGNGRTDRLFVPSLALNVLLDKRLDVDYGLAVHPPTPHAPTLFLIPYRGKVLAGTLHVPRPVGTTEALPTEEEVLGFLTLLNEAVAGLDVTSGHVLRTFAGLLPAAARDTPALQRRERLRDHARAGGPEGLYSVSGVKFSTASDVAAQVLRMIHEVDEQRGHAGAFSLSSATPVVISPPSSDIWDTEHLVTGLRQLAAQEAVHCAEDFVMRRTNWSTTEVNLHRLTAELGRSLGLPASVQSDRNQSDAVGAA